MRPRAVAQVARNPTRLGTIFRIVLVDQLLQPGLHALGHAIPDSFETYGDFRVGRRFRGHTEERNGRDGIAGCSKPLRMEKRDPGLSHLESPFGSGLQVWKRLLELASVV